MLLLLLLLENYPPFTLIVFLPSFSRSANALWCSREINILCVEQIKKNVLWVQRVGNINARTRPTQYEINVTYSSSPNEPKTLYSAECLEHSLEGGSIEMRATRENFSRINLSHRALDIISAWTCYSNDVTAYRDTVHTQYSIIMNS